MYQKKPVDDPADIEACSVFEASEPVIKKYYAGSPLQRIAIDFWRSHLSKEYSDDLFNMKLTFSEKDLKNVKIEVLAFSVFITKILEDVLETNEILKKQVDLLTTEHNKTLNVLNILCEDLRQ